MDSLVQVCIITWKWSKEYLWRHPLQGHSQKLKEGSFSFSIRFTANHNDVIIITSSKWPPHPGFQFMKLNPCGSNINWTASVSHCSNAAEKANNSIRSHPLLSSAVYLLIVFITAISSAGFPETSGNPSLHPCSCFVPNSGRAESDSTPFAAVYRTPFY